MSNEKSPKEMVKYEAKNLKIDYPKSEYLTEDEMKRPQKAIENHGVALGNNKTMVEKKALPSLLCTDVKGSNKVYGKIGDDDKYSNGDKKFVSTSAIKKVISDRIEEPRNSLKREKLKYNELCLDAFRDSDTLENNRAKEEARISNELPKLANKIRKERNLDNCEATDEPLTKGYAAHHQERKADNPHKALERENIKIVNEDPHVKIHVNNYEGEDGFKNFRRDFKGNNIGKK
ncbi:hypothetical protein [Fusibacter bizertensis]